MTRAIMAMVAGGAIAGCTVEGGKDVPLIQGQGAVGVDPATQTVTLDTAKVPVVPACAPGQVVRRDAAGAGWECVVPQVRWSNVQERPADFPPATHAHPTIEAAITALQQSGPHAHPSLEAQVAALQDASSAMQTHTHDASQIVGFRAAVAAAMDGATVVAPAIFTGGVGVGGAASATDKLNVTGSARVSGNATVVGTLTVSGGLKADYDSNWFAVTNTSQTFTANHNLGVLPSRYQLLWSSTSGPGTSTFIYDMTGRTVEDTGHGGRTGILGIRMHHTQFQISMWSGGYTNSWWNPTSGWENYTAGYYRVLLWK